MEFSREKEVIVIDKDPFSLAVSINIIAFDFKAM